MARLTFQPTTTYAFISRFRFDEETLDVRRVELESRVQFERWSVRPVRQLRRTAGDRNPDAPAGHPHHRVGQADAELVAVSAGCAIDIEAQQLNQTTFGLGYIDDCFGIRMTYTTDYGYTAIR